MSDKSDQNQHQLNIRVEKELKTAFIQKAKENDTTATDLLVDFMRQYLGIETKQPTTSIDVEVIEKKLSERLDSRIAELEQRLSERLDNNRIDERLDERIADAVNNQLSERVTQTEQELADGSNSQLNSKLEEIVNDRIADAVRKLNYGLKLQVGQQVVEQVELYINQRLETELGKRIAKQVDDCIGERLNAATTPLLDSSIGKEIYSLGELVA